MLSPIAVYAFVFLTLVLVPAGLLWAVLFFVERRSWPWLAPAPSPSPASRTTGKPPQRRGLTGSLHTRFPRTAQFVSRRMDPHHPWGLLWTLAGLAMLAGLWLFLGVTEDVMTRDPLVTFDLRLHHMVAAFRTPALTQVMLVLTGLGSPVVLTLLCAAMALWAMAARRPRLAAGVLSALLLVGLLSVSLKALFSHPRPLDAIITAHEASFPSGHMLGSAVVYGLMAALLLSSGLKRSLRALGVVALLLLTAGVGLSRLYLGVHWPSDLLGSLALALMLLALVLFFLHYRGRIDWLDSYRLPFPGATALRAAGAVLVLLAPGAAVVMAGRTRLLVAPAVPLALPVSLQQLQTGLPAGLPRWSEDITGGQRVPVSVLLVGQQADMTAAFKRAGWRQTDALTPLRLLQETFTRLAGLPDPTGPVTPAFYADKPQDLSFEKTDVHAPDRRRYHQAQLWKTGYCLLPDCRPLWVATTRFDAGLDTGLDTGPDSGTDRSRKHLSTPQTDSVINHERAVIVADLTAASASRAGSVPISPATQGTAPTDASGALLQPDGRAAVLVLP